MGFVQLVTESPYVRRARRASPVGRLICFPFAGAAATAYRDWPELLPDDIELIALQLPGREDRLREEPFTDSRPLARALVQVLRLYLDLPLTLFGHSGGSLLAFEVARLLEARTGAPVGLIASGHRAPHQPARTAALRDLPDAEFLIAIAELDGTAHAVLTDDGLRRVILPALRADVTMMETYAYQPGAPLTGPVTVFGGDHDPLVPTDDLQEWRQHTTGDFQVRLFAGNHFFLHESRPAVLAAIAAELVEPRLTERAAR